LILGSLGNQYQMGSSPKELFDAFFAFTDLMMPQARLKGICHVPKSKANLKFDTGFRGNPVSNCRGLRVSNCRGLRVSNYRGLRVSSELAIPKKLGKLRNSYWVQGETRLKFPQISGIMRPQVSGIKRSWISGITWPRNSGINVLGCPGNLSHNDEQHVK